MAAYMAKAEFLQKGRLLKRDKIKSIPMHDKSSIKSLLKKIDIEH